MFATKVKTGALALALLLVAAGAGVWAQQVLSPKPGEEARQAMDLPGPVENEQQVRVDRHGDPLPTGAVARLGTLRWRRPNGGNLVFSPDGKTLAAGEEGRHLSLWDVSTGKQIRRFTAPAESKEMRLASGDMMKADLATFLTPVGFSPDGKRLFSVAWGSFETHTARVWDVATGKELHRYKLPKKSTKARLSPDGKLLVCFGEAEVRLWEADTGKDVRGLEGTEGLGTHINAFSPDGRFVVGEQVSRRIVGKAESDSTVWLWEVATGKRVQRIDDPQDISGEPIWSRPGAAFSWDNRLLATANKEGPILLWDLASGRELRRLVGHARMVRQLAFSRDGQRLLSKDTFSPIHVWDVATGRALHKLGEREEYWTNAQYSGWHDQMVLSPDDKLAATSDYHAIQLLDVATGKQLLPFEGHDKQVREVAFLKDGTVVSADDRGSLRRWEGATGRPLGGHPGMPTRSIRLSPDGKLLARYHGAEKPAVEVRDTASGSELWRIPLSLQGAVPPGLAFSPDGTTLAVCVGNYIPRVPLGAPPGNVQGALGLWEAATGKERWLKTDLAAQGSLAFSPDGKLLVFRNTSTDKDVTHLLDAATGQLLYASRDSGWVDFACTPLAFAPDGKVLATVSRVPDPKAYDATINLWEVATGRERGQLIGHKSIIEALAVSPDGRLVVSACHDGTVRLWDVATCRERARLRTGPVGTLVAEREEATSRRDHAGCVRCLAFSHDGRFLVTGSDDTTLLVWDVASLVKSPEPVARPSEKDIDATWAALAGADAKAAHQAIFTLAAAPERSVPLLRQRLRPAPPVAAEQMKQWLKELDDPRFAQRDLASRQLEAAGAAAEPHLKQALAGQPSPELRQRLEQLMKKLQGPVAHPEHLRSLRAMEVLERVGTVDACALLKVLAAGAPAARQTREAEAALRRLERSAVGSP